MTLRRVIDAFDHSAQHSLSIVFKCSRLKGRNKIDKPIAILHMTGVAGG